MSDFALRLLPYLGLAALVLAAIGFATFPVWRTAVKGRALLAAAIALFLLGVGLGSYGMLGRPNLALRASKGLATREINGLIPYLIARVRATPGDEQAWAYLGRAYLSANDAGDAAKAYGRAVTLMRLAHRPDPDLDTAYGGALVAEAGGTVPAEAETAFTEALKINPEDPAARFYLGQARALRGDRAGAIALWQSLLAEVPVSVPLHQILVDRIALLTAASGGTPDPRQMVAGLAARLKADPHDAQGWQRLIRAYTVLGETDEAKEALATARKTFAADRDVTAALDGEAKDLKLQ
jgi:cytochrome c-type biogenesis protein CcmH